MACTALSFCKECGLLRLQDVTEQLQKLFTDKRYQPNVCGICQKEVKDVSRLSSNEKKTSGKVGAPMGNDNVQRETDSSGEIVTPKSNQDDNENQSQIEERRRSNVYSINVIYSVDRSYYSNIDSDLSNETVHRVTSLSSGAVQGQQNKREWKSSENYDSEDNNDATGDNDVTSDDAASSNNDVARNDSEHPTESVPNVIPTSKSNEPTIQIEPENPTEITLEKTTTKSKNSLKEYLEKLLTDSADTSTFNSQLHVPSSDIPAKPIKKRHRLFPNPDLDISHITKMLDPKVVDIMGIPVCIDMPFKCKYCNTQEAEWRLAKAFLKHMKKIHAVPLITKPYVCDQCDTRCPTLFDVRRHNQVHTHTVTTETKSFKCDHTGCDKAFKLKRYLKNHQATHKGLNYMCSRCGRRFITNAKLMIHKHVHSDVKRYKCEYCGKAFKTDRYKKNHIESLHNNGERLWVCEVCGKRFKSKRQLCMHNQLHKEKKYSCEHCNYRCARSDYLLNHRRIHTGDTPYQCAHCDRQFSLRTTLRLHERKQHPSEVNISSSDQRPEVLATTASTSPSIPLIKDNTHSATADIDAVLELEFMQHDLYPGV